MTTAIDKRKRSIPRCRSQEKEAGRRKWFVVYGRFITFFQYNPKENRREGNEKEEEEQGTRKKEEGRATRASPAALSYQNSRARRDKRAAGRAIRRELQEQMPAS